jgi:4-amino-4-deoxy-L-arabinose transferase-like glycosyltransferase
MENTDRTFPWAIVLLFVVLKLLFHFLTNTNYELHRDAYLYIAQSDHLSWGYISVPPLTAFLTTVFRDLFGDSLFALRLLPAVVGGFTVLILSLSVREFGGGKWALILANSSYLFSVSYLRTNTLLQPVAIDVFFWCFVFYFILRLVKSGDPRYWIPFAVVAGTGFLNKYSMAFLAAGFLLALIISSERKLIRNRYFFFALITGMIIILPNVLWQYRHNWPVLYHFEMLNRYQLINVRLDDFLMAQILMNLNGIIIWVAGLSFLLFHRSAVRYRVLGYTFLFVMLILILSRGKHYYALGLYPVLFAAGGYVFERYVGRRLYLYASLLFIVLISIPLLPVGLPLLKHDRMLRYSQVMRDYGLELALRWEDGSIHPLPQDYADMIGWKELADKVISIYHDLPGAEKEKCYIYAENYGQAGAINFYGRKAGLPEVICFNGSFVFWAPDHVDDLNTLIYVNDEIDELEALFSSVQKAGEITDPYARESGTPIWLCRDPDSEFHDLYRQRILEERGRFVR